MRTKLFMIIATSIISVTASANSMKILCEFKESPLFNIHIIAETYESSSGGFYGKAPADIYIKGPRLSLAFKTEIIKSPILTRTIVGTSYKVNLNNTDSLDLSDIYYAPSGSLGQIGFSGLYKQNEQIASLVCKYF